MKRSWSDLCNTIGGVWYGTELGQQPHTIVNDMLHNPNKSYISLHHRATHGLLFVSLEQIK